MATRSPFDDTDADIVFRSSDEVDFRLYKNVLAKASPVFQGMFTLPTDVDTPRDQIVPLTENADTLEGLFRLCYPVERPRFTNLDQLRAVVEAARKYQMNFVFVSLKDSPLQFLDNEPLRVYAIVYIMQLGDIACIATQRLLELPDFADPVPPPPEFNELPAIALHYVFAYRRKCAIAARSELDNMDWMVFGDHCRRVSTNSSGYRSGASVDTSGSCAWLSCPNKPFTPEHSISLRRTPAMVHGQQIARSLPPPGGPSTSSV